MKYYNLTTKTNAEKTAQRARLLHNVQRLVCDLPNSARECELVSKFLTQTVLANDWCLTRKDCTMLYHYIDFYSNLAATWRSMKGGE